MATALNRETITDLLREGATSRMHQLGVLALVALLLAPLFLSKILMLKLAGAMFFAVFTISWDFVSGYTGEISFGHAIFFGSAGYGSAILNTHFGWDPLLTIPIGILCAIGVGIIIGVPSLRLEGPYLSLVTLVAPLLLLQIFVYFREYTGGQRGLFGVDSILSAPLPVYYLAFAVLLVSLAVSLALTRSNLGTIMKAIQGDEEVVAASGLNPAKYKIFAFVMSGVIGGFAGAIFTHTSVGSATPSLLLGLIISANVIIAAVIGGMGTISGAAVGGFAFFMVRDILRNVDWVIPVVGIEFTHIYLLLLFFIAGAVLIFLPDGFIPWLAGKLDSNDEESDGMAIGDGGRPPASRAAAKFRRQIRAVGSKEDDDEH